MLRFVLRFVRRFAVVYLVLYSFPAPLQYLPKLDTLTDHVDQLWAPVVGWFGAHVLGVDRPITMLTNGSGDTTFNYLEVAWFAALAIVIGAAWTLLDRRRDDAKLMAGLRYYCALVVGLAMFLYGIDKVLLQQFPAPSPSDLARPLGRYSPMSLLWVFIGWSAPYQFVAGALEVVGGALLLFRRTARLGALVLVPVLVNVVLFNVCYDVPVKLYSSHLLAMVLVVLAPDARRLIDVIVLRRMPAPEPPIAPLVDRPWAARATTAFSAVWLAIGLGVQTHDMLATRSERAELHDTPLLGNYRATGAVDGRQIRRLSVNSKTTLVIERDDASVSAYAITTDTARRVLTFNDDHGAPSSSKLMYAQPSADVLRLDGELAGQPVHVELHRLDPAELSLDSWSVQAIHETPPEEEPRLGSDAPSGGR